MTRASLEKKHEIQMDDEYFCMNIIYSPFLNPYINLSLENYFLRNLRDKLLFLYVNRPCVVFGRFQNPWIETNLSYLSKNDIWPVRRQSGGGCVFHDEGNLNFSFLTPGPLVDRKMNALTLMEIFKTVGIELTLSPRNDLWLLDENDGVSKKISGSAYKQTREASFHHGTLLISTDLTKLEESLKSTSKVELTRSIPSVRSRVMALSQRYPGLELRDVVELMGHYFKTPIDSVEGVLLSHPEVEKSFREQVSWEWLWGETPHFELATQGGVLSIKKGVVESSEKRFIRESMEEVMTREELDRLFPDFSELHSSSNRIY